MLFKRTANQKHDSPKKYTHNIHATNKINSFLSIKLIVKFP